MMNERLKEIAEECHHAYSEHRIDLEKFAKMIILESANLLEGFEMMEEVADGEYVDYEAKTELLKHWNIKED